MAAFTLEDKQIAWTDKSPSICPSDVNLCCTVVNLFISTRKSSWKNHFSREPKGDYLFILLAHQTICSSEAICLSRWFVRPLV